MALDELHTHPNRVEARKKLAALSDSRLKDLCGDLFVELGRRYPGLAGDGEHPYVEYAHLDERISKQKGASN